VCPTTPLGITTGIWLFSDPSARLATIASWSTVPDYVRIGFEDVLALPNGDSASDNGALGAVAFEYARGLDRLTSTS
jgi:uncharacterized protein (DUF849 family)